MEVTREKKLIKLTKDDFGTALIGSVVAVIFNPEDTSKLLNQHFLNLSKDFLIHILFWFSFLSSFQLENYVFSSFCLYGQRPLCEIDIVKFYQKYESFKMPPIRLLICMISASFLPNLAPLLLLA